MFSPVLGGGMVQHYILPLSLCHGSADSEPDCGARCLEKYTQDQHGAVLIPAGRALCLMSE